MSLAEKQIATAKALFAGYDEYTADAVMRVRADNCIHAILPKSLGRPSKNNEEYREFFAPLNKIMRSFKVTIHKIVNDPEHHQCAIYASGVGDSPVAPYKNEYVFFLAFTEDGEKITLIEEFVDSAFGKEFLAKVNEYKKDHPELFQ